jgi:hypothetical protein
VILSEWLFERETEMIGRLAIKTSEMGVEMIIPGARNERDSQQGIIATADLNIHASNAKDQKEKKRETIGQREQKPSAGRKEKKRRSRNRQHSSALLSKRLGVSRPREKR